ARGGADGHFGRNRAVGQAISRLLQARTPRGIVFGRIRSHPQLRDLHIRSRGPRAIAGHARFVQRRNPARLEHTGRPAIMNFGTLIGAAMLALSATAFAAAPASPDAQVEHAWIRWLPARLPAAGYTVIRNEGDEILRITGARSPDYGMVMLHHSRLAHGDSTMEMVDHLDIPPHGSVTLAPGGYHLMLSQ